MAQAALIPGDLKGKLDWLNGKVSWHKGASVNTTFTNAGPDAMVVGSTGNGVLANWVAHPDNSMAQASETLPISGLALHGQRGQPEGHPLHGPRTGRWYRGRRDPSLGWPKGANCKFAGGTPA